MDGEEGGVGGFGGQFGGGKGPGGRIQAGEVDAFAALIGVGSNVDFEFGGLSRGNSGHGGQQEENAAHEDIRP